ncbi:terpene cyclase/mutase family protein, partial [Streptomyces sp. SID3343]|uniref:terpene cyclase/mutase family protein n=1 Tax=Streptomyces sp. SID3343 TaxID=2690260 RepID=UPI00136A37C8
MPSPRRRTRAAAATVLTTALLSSVWTGGVAGAATTPPDGPGGSLRSAAAFGRLPAATPVAPPAMYGKSDPSADGVYRQSLAIVALASADARPAPQAVEWLLAQQCADGGFATYRADPGVPCDVAREDTVATSIAVQALVSLRTYATQAGRGADWLKSKQLPDGSYAAFPGAPAPVGDPTSTAFAVNALVATGVNPDTQKTAQGRTPADALKSMQVVCPAPTEALGAFRGAAGGAGDPLVTARATLALGYGKLPAVPT